MPDKAARSPPGACDCHVHIYDDRFAQVPNLAVIPPRAPVSAYREVQRRLGLERVVIVQPAAYGFDKVRDEQLELGTKVRALLVAKGWFGSRAGFGMVGASPAAAATFRRKLADQALLGID